MGIRAYSGESGVKHRNIVNKGGELGIREAWRQAMIGKPALVAQGYRSLKTISQDPLKALDFFHLEECISA